MKALCLFPIAFALACGLENGGLTTDASTDRGLEDRGTGVTDSGVPCTCVASPGNGWQFIAYARDNQGADCPSQFSTKKFAVEETKMSAAQCMCSCAPNLPANCAVNISIDVFKQSGTCTGSPNATVSGSNTVPPVACVPTNQFDANNGPLSAKATATVMPSGGSCTPTSTATIDSDLHKGQGCNLTGSLGFGCSGTDACVPNPSSGFALCVMNPMPKATCPPGFPTQHRVGSGKIDSRDCQPACACTPNPQCTLSVQFFQNGNCNMATGLPLAVDGTCHGISNMYDHFNSFNFNATVMQQCTASGFMPIGSVSLSDEFTICCP